MFETHTRGFSFLFSEVEMRFRSIARRLLSSNNNIPKATKDVTPAELPRSSASNVISEKSSGGGSIFAVAGALGVSTLAVYALYTGEDISILLENAHERRC